MARALIWSAEARADLKEIEAYIDANSSGQARRVVAKIREAVNKQPDFPYSARMIPEFQDPNRREIFVYQYRLMYRIQPHRIRVLRVVHGRRLLKNVPGRFEERSQADYSAA
jgi:toxin ParE1/3/4